MQLAARDSRIEHPVWLDHRAQSEEVPVTLQLGFVGTDGLLIASDKKASFAADPTRTSSLTCKMHWNVENGIVCAGAGNDAVAPSIGRELVTHPVPDAAARDDVFKLLQNRVDELWRMHVPKKRNGEPDRNPDSHLIVGLLRNENHLWRISACRGADSGGPYLDKITAGDPRNAAKYFSERFYKRIPVEKLALLAAHVIFEGANLNSPLVEGLDILSWEWKEREPHFFSESEKESLVKKSESLTAQINSLLLGDEPGSTEV